MNYSHKSGLSPESYIDKVHEILESFDYPNLVAYYNASDVARSMSGVMRNCYIFNESPMMCAVIIWSMTMHFQIIPDAKSAVKH